MTTQPTGNPMYMPPTYVETFLTRDGLVEEHYVPPRERTVRKKFKYQDPGSCGACNEVCNGACDGPEVSKSYKKSVKPGGTCGCCNAKGCCDREKLWIRRGSSVESWQLKELQIHTKSSRKRSKNKCC
ncbi:hypothetical protein GNI_134550 [Gregarina niphandrodes]|uniref:Uncharacterized protein n=1 Tax=Gregarina niphandrodes TaxID=110365 RepID=A0A023B0Z2_GRENI|nr:hypothetical protein GNI_134550 [Gregarina niphandrodes]EZG46179.1 hypothetical protein GNI_134550 [Gregarina niphandrodes]|eukprot:XP_011132340.1 hypothetical protein GNI_134550 [Gregarina niphandrodes]